MLTKYGPEQRSFFRRLFADTCFSDVSLQNYLVIDTETTTADPEVARVLQLGYCNVQDGKATTRGSILIRVAPDTFIHPAAAATHGITLEKCGAEGVDPAVAYTEFCGLVNDVYRAGGWIVGHNAYAFDLPLLGYEAARYSTPFIVDRLSHRLIDTGLLAKAAQISYRGPLLPDATEDRTRYYRRVRDIRSRVKWNITYCWDFYDVATVAHDVDPSSAHDAGTDCLLTHFILKRFHQISQEADAA